MLELYNPFEGLEELKKSNPEQYKDAKKRLDEVMPKVAEGMAGALGKLIKEEAKRQKKEEKEKKEAAAKKGTHELTMPDVMAYLGAVKEDILTNFNEYVKMEYDNGASTSDNLKQIVLGRLELCKRQITYHTNTILPEEAEAEHRKVQVWTAALMNEGRLKRGELPLADPTDLFNDLLNARDRLAELANMKPKNHDEEQFIEQKSWHTVDFIRFAGDKLKELFPDDFEQRLERCDEARREAKKNG